MSKKITFENKEDSVNLNSNSKFVLTAANVNEIKDVVNSISNEFDNRITISQILRYFRFNVPSGLDASKSIFYSIKFELSRFEDFREKIEIDCMPNFETYKNSIVEFPVTTSNTIFKVFKNGKWIEVSDLYFNSLNEGTEIQIDLYGYIKEFEDSIKEFPFYGRYKIIKLYGDSESWLESNWNGFSLSFSNYNNSLNFPKTYDSIEIIGDTTIFGKGSSEYYVYGIKDGIRKENITNKCSFKILNESISSIDFNTITANDVLVNELQMLVAECTIDGFYYSSKLNINICPLKIVDYWIDGPDVIKEGEEAEYTIHGRLSSGEIIDLLNDSEIILSSSNCSKTISNNKLIISCKDEVYDNEVFTLVSKCNAVNGYFTSIASKLIFVRKTLWTSFKIQHYEGDSAETNGSDGDYIGNLGLINGSSFTKLHIKPILTGPSSHEFDDFDNIELKEVGSSRLTFEKVELDGSKYFEVKLIDQYDIKGKTDLLISIIYNNKTSGKIITKICYLTVYTDEHLNIKQIKIALNKNVLNEDDTITYNVIGITTSGNIINLNNLAIVSVNSILENVEVDPTKYEIKSSTFESDTVGYVKAVYNDLSAYEDVYFKK